jgi:hypothetical protein
MINLKIKNLQIEPGTTKDNHWYAYATFNLSDKRKVLGPISKRTTYTLEDFMLLVGPPSLEAGQIDGASQEDIEKQLTMTKLDNQAIEIYVAAKVSEASRQPDLSRYSLT